MSTEEDPYRRQPVQAARGPLQLGEEPLQFSSNPEERNRAPHNLGGWLRLVTLMMFIAPLNLIGVVFMTFNIVAELGLAGADLEPTVRLALMTHVWGGALLLLLNLVALVLLFLKSRWFPRVFIGWLALELMLTIIAVVLLGCTDGAPGELEHHFTSVLGRALMFDIPWIAYAILSKRVKRTFAP